MDELDLATRLRHAVADDPPVRLDLHSVLAAGRRRRRTDVAVRAAAVLVLTVGAAVLAPTLVGQGPRDRVTAASPGVPDPSVAPGTPAPPQDPLSGADLSGVSAAQAAEIADREATADEYRAAYGRYRACMSAAGYELEAMPPVLARGVHSFSVPTAAVDSGADGECYDRDFKYTDMLWQGSPGVHDRSTGSGLLRGCLQQRGIEPGGSAAQVDEQVRAAGIDPGECFRPQPRS